MNPYDVLEIPREASDKDIKDAYRQLAKQWHPDKNKAANAEEKFKEINKAYNILIDPELRRRYDQTGSVDEQNVPTEVDINELFKGMMGGMGGMGGFPGMMGGFPGMMGGMPGMQTVFVNGVPMGGMGMNPQEMFMRRNSNIKIQIEISLNETFNGLKKNLDYQYKDLENGNMIKDVLELNILKGIKDGQEIAFKNKGHKFKDSRGDLVVRIKEVPHKDFTRSNNDLIYNLKISLVQSICGFETIIKGIDGQKLIIKNFNLIIKNNDRKVIREHGMPILGKSNRGDLIINFEINYPDTLTDDTKNKLASIFEYDNKSKYNNTNTTGYVVCELDPYDTEVNNTETENTEGGERVQCAQQ
jgi:DnaJ family protein B protein 4